MKERIMFLMISIFLTWMSSRDNTKMIIKCFNPFIKIFKIDNSYIQKYITYRLQRVHTLALRRKEKKTYGEINNL